MLGRVLFYGYFSMLGLTLLLILIAVLIKVKQKSKCAFIFLMLFPVFFYAYNSWLYEGHIFEPSLSFEENSYRYRVILDEDIKSMPRLSNKYIFGYYSDVDRDGEVHYVRFCNVEDMQYAETRIKEYIKPKGILYRSDDVDFSSKDYFVYSIEGNCIMLFKELSYHIK